MEVLRYADVVLDERRGEVSRAGRRIDLTATEFSLLRYFLLHPRRVVSKPRLLREVWRYEAGGSVNLVETYVSYLRRKLEREGPPLIRTVRQSGYILDDEADVSRPVRASLRIDDRIAAAPARRTPLEP
ncbi:MAG TPA: winged helix-turn-helix domain-containing protein [Gaiellaceae bacterium]|jgi:two-component system OmpR family response regulator|nr:winged helix-turn-helix domain-containing protein [Gaiellaceae bacterium]